MLQKEIMKKDWKILILLDACRYDMFKIAYKEFYPDLEVKKVISPSTYTCDWLVKTFPDFYDDVVYISANPYVNSTGARVGHEFRSWTKKEFNSFCGLEHFPIIADVWKNFDPNKYKGAVTPDKVNKAFHKYCLKYPKKRFILHYMQPHRPYITTPTSISFTKKNHTPNWARDTFSMVMNWKIKKLLLKKPTSFEERMYRQYGSWGLKQVYLDEIRNVLEYAKHITDALNVNFVITSDHGERLGEHWWHMSHGPGPRHKEVIEVPWLEISS